MLPYSNSSTEQPNRVQKLWVVQSPFNASSVVHETGRSATTTTTTTTTYHNQRMLLEPMQTGKSTEVFPCIEEDGH
jgi:hypothetical protein